MYSPPKRRSNNNSLGKAYGDLIKFNSILFQKTLNLNQEGNILITELRSADIFRRLINHCFSLLVGNPITIFPKVG